MDNGGILKCLRVGFLVLLAAAVLTVPVFADIGPKPQIVVRVENGPEELYYLDLLREGTLPPLAEQTVGGLKDNYTEEELAALDQDLLADLMAAVPEGWLGCITQGVLVWGNIGSEDGYHRFSYIGVPDICRILMVTKSGEVFLSEPFDRQVLQSSATVDWAAKTVRTPPVFLGYAVQFLATFLPTLAVEGALLLLFHLWSRRNGWVFLAANLVTQGALTLWMSVWTVRGGTYWLILLKDYLLYMNLQSLTDLPGLVGLFPYTYGILPAELAILLAEMGLYVCLFRECSKKRAALYGLTANVCSFLLGLCVSEPVWKFFVRTIL